jgi:prophage regulatory protein
MQSYIFIRKQAVLAKSGIGSTTLHERVHANLMPAPINLGGSVSAYLSHEIDAVLAARAAGFNDEQVKTIVINLEAKRKDNATELLNSLRAGGAL